MYQYSAEIIKIIDGDTVRLTVDFGCDISLKMTVRLAGINATEGKASGSSLESLLLTKAQLTGISRRQVWVETVKDRKEKFGHYLGWLYTAPEHLCQHEKSINQAMIDQGHAVSYDGGKR